MRLLYMKYGFARSNITSASVIHKEKVHLCLDAMLMYVMPMSIPFSYTISRYN